MNVTIMTIVGLWTFRVLIAFTLHRFRDIGLYGVMAGISTDFTVRAGMYLSRMRAGKWELLKVWQSLCREFNFIWGLT